MYRYVHTNIVARDANKLIEFYTSVLQCRRIGQTRDLRAGWLDKLTGLRGAHITGEHLLLPGYGERGPTLEIFQYDQPEADLDRAINRPGLAHLAFAVDDADAALQAVLDAGGSTVGERVSTVYTHGRISVFVYARDPEGNIIELQSSKPVGAETGTA
jgi:catechol 2,3-dioxygenase-like lactoylglutathione lyase family enzyme